MEHPVQAHHGGSLWLFDGDGWFLVRNLAGVEWSAQWAADPQKIDLLRQNALRLYARFPETLDELDRLGYHEAREILDAPITDSAGVARWTDCLFNACVPLPASLHTGSLGVGHPTAGYHHYPQPIVDIQLVKRDDFQLFVTDPATGQELAVVPVDHRGSGRGEVQVVYAPHGSPHHAAQHAAEAAGEPYVLPADHPLAKQAFARQKEIS